MILANAHVPLFRWVNNKFEQLAEMSNILAHSFGYFWISAYFIKWIFTLRFWLQKFVHNLLTWLLYVILYNQNTIILFYYLFSCRYSSQCNNYIDYYRTYHVTMRKYFKIPLTTFHFFFLFNSTQNCGVSQVQGLGNLFIDLNPANTKEIL